MTRTITPEALKGINTDNTIILVSIDQLHIRNFFM